MDPSGDHSNPKTSQYMNSSVLTKQYFVLHLAQYLRKLPELFFYCDSPCFEMQVCHMAQARVAKKLLNVTF